jgi:1,4-dihydroxy-2-naphthoate octaprenyltransferase
MNRWITGARPRTLPAAVVPVAVGAAAAVGEPTDVVWWRVGAALVVSLSLQVGVNYANDYSDGVRGTDDVRVGPTRLVASGLASPAAVKRAALTSFAVAGVAGLAIALATSPLLLLVGVAAIAAGWFYTGGPKPYGYLGLGEVFVFVFFGLVATAGTTYAAIESVRALSWVMGAAVGSLACALLVINNLRDIPTDREVGKRTLAVVLGEEQTRYLYAFLVAIAVIALLGVGLQTTLLAMVALVFLFPAVPALRLVLGGTTGRALLPVLQRTGTAELVYAAALFVALVV